MVELVDTLDLGSSAAMRGGSSPLIRTKFRGLSSVGRAIALQAIGQRFDPVRLHQNCPVRLSVRTTAFQAVKRSSILLRDTIYYFRGTK